MICDKYLDTEVYRLKHKCYLLQKMKKKNKEKAETDFSSLLVFGYGCTLFRDDQRALSLEAGDHLIPWMGDTSLRIGCYPPQYQF